MSFIRKELLYPPEAPAAAPAGPASMNKDDVIEFLKGDDEPDVIPLADKEDKKAKNDDKEDKEDKEGEEGEDDEIKALEDDLKEPTDEDLELVTPVRKKEILKKYPTLFKDFPYLEKAYYREQQFTELFPTPADAREAQSKSEILDAFESDLGSGNSEKLFSGLKSSDANAFYKVVDNLLPTLAKVDEKAYHNVIGNITKHTITAAIQEARESKNEALEVAAGIIYKFVFGSSKYEAPTKLATEKPAEENKVEEERNQFLQQRFEDSRDDLNSKINNSLKATILANIDPKESMSEFVKKHSANEAFDEVAKLIDSDSRFKVILDRLWEKAAKSNFNRQSMEEIKSAYFSKARTLLPTVIKKARNEALRGMGKRVKEEEVEEEVVKPGRSAAPETHRRQQPSRTSGGSSSKVPAGMSSLDYLLSDD